MTSLRTTGEFDARLFSTATRSSSLARMKSRQAIQKMASPRRTPRGLVDWTADTLRRKVFADATADDTFASPARQWTAVPVVRMDVGFA